MIDALDPVDRKLLDGWQRDFPLVSRPFTEIARQVRITEDDVLDRLRRLDRMGSISRIGATCRPNTASASTLAAIAAPHQRIEGVAATVAAEPGVNHAYLRENAWNIWFVVAGPDRDDVDATLDRIRAQTGLRVLDLPLVRAFNVDLGFSLDGTGRVPPGRPAADRTAMLPDDRPIMQVMSAGLDLVASPFRSLGESLGRREEDVLARVRALASAGVFSRIGVIVRHRALGWTSNAMVVWDVPEPEIESTGPELARTPGITLCYQRRPIPDAWPYDLYCMIHARSRGEALEVLQRARQIGSLARASYRVLFSLRCFRQRGALINGSPGVTA